MILVLKLYLTPLYGRTYYVLDVEAKSSTAKLFSSIKATQRTFQLSYIVEIASHCIFSKSEATTALVEIQDEVLREFYITFAVESVFTKKQQSHNINKLALFGPNTKWRGNELPINDVNCVNVSFRSRNGITVSDDRVQSQIHPDTAKISLFQDVEDIKFKYICDNDASNLDIITLYAIAILQLGLFSLKKIFLLISF